MTGGWNMMMFKVSSNLRCSKILNIFPLLFSPMDARLQLPKAQQLSTCLKSSRFCPSPLEERRPILEKDWGTSRMLPCSFPPFPVRLYSKVSKKKKKWHESGPDLHHIGCSCCNFPEASLCTVGSWLQALVGEETSSQE